jgi:PI-3-kinase-related kinase SMG-1
VVSKPSDAFYSKVLPLLRRHGVLKMEDRKAWPISLLKQVLQELVQETPNDLLTTELWLKSVSSRSLPTLLGS